MANIYLIKFLPLSRFYYTKKTAFYQEYLALQWYGWLYENTGMKHITATPTLFLGTSVPVLQSVPSLTFIRMAIICTEFF